MPHLNLGRELRGPLTQRKLVALLAGRVLVGFHRELFESQKKLGGPEGELGELLRELGGPPRGLVGCERTSDWKGAGGSKRKK